MSIPIHVVAKRPLIYDLEIVKLLRERYHVCGTLIGILPQVPQQNVFMGLPVELMPEDVEYLVDDLKVGYIVDDKSVHDMVAANITNEDLKKLEQERTKLRQQKIEIHQRQALRKRQQALAKKSQNQISNNSGERSDKGLEKLSEATVGAISCEISTTSLSKEKQALPSYDLFESQYRLANSSKKTIDFIDLPSRASYNIYKFLQQHNYYVSPGLRFGGQFLAYPGDPLRFHSHNIAIGFDWDQEFNILDIVGGGRLATSVKKCWVLGSGNIDDDKFCAYSIEWAGFG